VLVILLIGGCGTESGRGPTSTASEQSSTTTLASTTTSTTTTSTMTTSTTTTTPPPPSSTTTTTAPAPPIRRLLGPGDSGRAVLVLQQRLSSLGYWLGAPDGVFGDSTEQAVYALQKAAGLVRDGIVGPATQAALAKGVVPQPRRARGHVVEIDLQQDLLMIVNNGTLYAVLNTSTGGGYIYVDEGVTAVANTPVGIFHVYREVDGLVVDSLGELWRPKYFDDGFAIHGDSYVPPEPVSHGCVRVSNEAIDWIWAENLLPIGTEVWIY